MITTYILVLFISGGGTAMTTVEGYATMGACEDAGKLWLQTQISGRRVGFHCLPRLSSGR